MGEIITLLFGTALILAVLLVALAVCKVVYFVKRTRYIFGLRKKLKMQQKGADEVTEGVDI